MRRLLLLFSFLLAASTSAQTGAPSVQSILDGFVAAGALADAADRAAAVDSVWTAVLDREPTPVVRADTALFLWRGTASLVAVAGDATGWQPRARLERVEGTNVWLRVDWFPPRARLDYKLVIDGSNWRLDPNNPFRQWGGFGPNSELRMSAWEPSPWTERRDDVPSGALAASTTVTSTAYARPVSYRVWTPAGYEGLDALPTVYVTDGHEYADDKLGALPIVLDNLIDAGRIEPCVVVFIDPRSGGANRREEQYVQNPGFATLVARDLVAAVEADYRVRTDREARTILGTSFGGLFAVYLALEHPDVFGNAAPQSPAFWVSAFGSQWTGPSLYARAAAASLLPRVAMTTGTILDTEDGARTMRDVLLDREADLTYVEVPESHSWGNWRALLDDILVALLPATATPLDAVADPEALDLRAIPNPSTAPALQVTVDRPARARLDCFDARGRHLAPLLDGLVPAGSRRVGLPPVAAGVYTCRLRVEGRTATTRVTVLD